MVRILLAAALLLPAAAGAQTVDRPMPHVEDGSDAEFPYSETYGSADARRDSYEDAAHAEDRARTAALNHRAVKGEQPKPRDDSAYRAALAHHEQDMADYKRRQDDYAARVADWHVRAAACRAGDPDACATPYR